MQPNMRSYPLCSGSEGFSLVELVAVAPGAAQCAVTYRASPAVSSEAAITDLHTGGC
jgi:hypothetical protein